MILKFLHIRKAIDEQRDDIHPFTLKVGFYHLSADLFIRRHEQPLLGHSPSRFLEGRRSNNESWQNRLGDTPVTFSLDNDIP